MKSMAWYGGAVVLALVACGGKTTVEGPGGSGGTSGAGGTSGTGGGLPDECAVSSSEAPPYAATFRFTNTTSTPLYLHEQCRVLFEVSSCVDGYGELLTLSGECTNDCADPDVGCIDCGACMDAAREVLPGESMDYAWGGNWYTFEPRAGCSCHVAHPALPGKYRVSIPVWNTEFDPYQSVPPASRVVTVPFELKANGIIDVPLAP